jgi:hypothetical protein
MATIKEFIDANRNAPGFEKEMSKLAKGYRCLEEVKATYDSWYGNIGQKRSLIPLNALKALFVCSQVQVAECLMEQALIAKKALDDMSPDAVDTTFYKGKIACARYYVNTVLPNAFLAAEVIKNEDDTVMTCPQEALIVH